MADHTHEHQADGSIQHFALATDQSFSVHVYNDDGVPSIAVPMAWLERLWELKPPTVKVLLWLRGHANQLGEVYRVTRSGSASRYEIATLREAGGLQILDARTELDLSNSSVSRGITQLVKTGLIAERRRRLRKPRQTHVYWRLYPTAHAPTAFEDPSPTEVEETQEPLFDPDQAPKTSVTGAPERFKFEAPDANRRTERITSEAPDAGRCTERFKSDPPLHQAHQIWGASNLRRFKSEAPDAEPCTERITSEAPDAGRCTERFKSEAPDAAMGGTIGGETPETTFGVVVDGVDEKTSKPAEADTAALEAAMLEHQAGHLPAIRRAAQTPGLTVAAVHWCHRKARDKEPDHPQRWPGLMLCKIEAGEWRNKKIGKSAVNDADQPSVERRCEAQQAVADESWDEVWRVWDRLSDDDLAALKQRTLAGIPSASTRQFLDKHNPRSSRPLAAEMFKQHERESAKNGAGEAGTFASSAGGGPPPITQGGPASPSPGMTRAEPARDH